MTNSLIIISPSAVTSPAPVLVRDPLIRPGTKFLFDMNDVRCHPGGAITTGAALSQTFTDLLGTVTAEVSSGSGITVNADGSLDFDGSAIGEELRVGTAGQFDQAPAEYESLAIVTMKLPASGFTTANFATAARLGASSTSNAQVWFDMGNGGVRPRVTVGTGAAGYTTTAAANVTPGEILQIAQHFVPGERLDIYINGVLSSSRTDSPPSEVQAAASAFFALPNALKRTMYRMSLHDLAASNAIEATRGLSADERLTVAQMVLADWQFTSGTLVGAPRDALS